MHKILLLVFFVFTFSQFQVRVQFTGVPNQYSILFQTNDSRTDHKSAVRFGYEQSALSTLRTGTTTPYTACLAYRSVTKEVVIEVLPEREIYFQVSNNVTNTPWSKVYKFKSVPTEKKDFSFVTYGDTGKRDVSKLLINQILKLDPKFIIHSGDYAYDL